MALPAESSALRTTRYGALAVVLLIVPTMLGLKVAAAGGSTPPEPDEVVVVASADSAENTTSGTQVASADDSTAFPRLTFVSADNERSDLDNGENIPLGDGLELAVSLDPFPPDQFHIEVDFELTRDGVLVSGVSFDTSWDMTFMRHGPFDTRFTETASGSHVADYEFFMFGPWRLDTVLTGVGDPIEFGIEIYVWPN